MPLPIISCHGTSSLKKVSRKKGIVAMAPNILVLETPNCWGNDFSANWSCAKSRMSKGNIRSSTKPNLCRLSIPTSQERVPVDSVTGSITVAPVQTNATRNILKPARLLRFLAPGKTGRAYKPVNIKRINIAIQVLKFKKNAW